MSCTDYLGFASMTLLIIGAVNWGVVAIRFSAGWLYDAVAIQGVTFPTANTTDVYIYEHFFPTPDLISILTHSAVVQMIVYWAVFLAGIFYLGLFVYSSIETRPISK